MSTGKASSSQPNPRLTHRRWQRLALVALALAALCLGACRQDMQDSPYLEPFEDSEFFDDGQANRQPPAGTVARGLLKDDTHFWFGRTSSGELVDSLPADMEWSQGLLERGQERFEIYCSVCHDSSGSGRGMIVRRGFKQPQPLYEQRLVEKPIGYFYDVMTNGFGIMPSYSMQVPESDRWAIAAYIRVLQTSQGMRFDELPADLQQDFQNAMAGHHDGDHAAGTHATDDHSPVATH